LRAVAQLPPRAPLVLQGWPLERVTGLVEALGGATTAPPDGQTGWRAVDVIPVGDTAVTVLAPGGAENLRPRFEQELAKAEGEIERARKKLADARFVERAPAHLVEAERDKLERFEREAAELRARLDALGE
jgi:valyl-tRNA synthetase